MATRFNREKDKKKRAATRIPKEGRIRCRVLNLVSPGRDIEAGVNGISFVIQDQAIVDLHPSQIEVLRHAVIETSQYKQNDAGEWSQVAVRIPRFMVEELGPVKEPEKEEDGKGRGRPKKNEGAKAA